MVWILLQGVVLIARRESGLPQPALLPGQQGLCLVLGLALGVTETSGHEGGVYGFATGLPLSAVCVWRQRSTRRLVCHLRVLQIILRNICKKIKVFSHDSDKYIKSTEHQQRTEGTRR